MLPASWEYRVYQRGMTLEACTEYNESTMAVVSYASMVRGCEG